MKISEPGGAASATAREIARGAKTAAFDVVQAVVDRIRGMARGFVDALQTVGEHPAEVYETAEQAPSEPRGGEVQQEHQHGEPMGGG